MFARLGMVEGGAGGEEKFGAGAVNEMALGVVVGERAVREEAGVGDIRDLPELQADFLSLTVHELRGPLGRIGGYLSMIRDGVFGDVPESMRTALLDAGAGVQEMATLLTGLAEVARLQDGADLLRRQPCQVRLVVTTAVEAVRPEAAAREIRVEPGLCDPALTVSADEERLRIALVNLLSNAVKYAPKGSTVDLRAERRKDGVAITVTDQGPGIDPTEARQVFEKHRRGRLVPETQPGLGLGLYLVRRIVEWHGGSVALDTKPGRGSAFTIVLP